MVGDLSELLYCPARLGATDGDVPLLRELPAPEGERSAHPKADGHEALGPFEGIPRVFEDDPFACSPASALRVLPAWESVSISKVVTAGGKVKSVPEATSLPINGQTTNLCSTAKRHGGFPATGKAAHVVTASCLIT